MTNNFTKIKPSDIPDMVKLKRKGLSFGDIGIKYNINPSTVFYHIRKSGLKYPLNKNNWGGDRKKGQTRTPSFSRKLKPVKMYSDYLREEKNKTLKKIYNKS